MTGLQVLIVDDDPDFAESLADVLSAHGHQVTTVSSGEEAVELFRRRDFDIAFMDVKLPGRTGVESFLDIRRIKPNARVAMMTGYGVPQLLDQAVQNGVWDVLHKPFDVDAVLQALERVRSASVVIADDDPDFVDVISGLLKSRGHRVLAAGSGREAVDLVRTGGIDVLILDLRLPILNGLGVYQELRRTGHTVPTIIVTAYAKEESAALDRLRRSEGVTTLVKPFDAQELVRAVERLPRRCGV